MTKKENIDLKNSLFHLSEKQWDMYNKWVKSLPYKYYGPINDGIKIIFTNCSIGVMVKAQREEGEEIDLTDWDTF